MRCALVIYCVVTVFVIVYSSLPELCEVVDYYGEPGASCGRDNAKYTFDFIPPIYQNIFSIDLRRQPLKQLPYNAFRNLSSQRNISKIWLEYCQISHVDAGALLNLHNLTEINLKRNDIRQIDSKLFSDTTQLKYINMVYNKIEVVPSGIFENLTLLEEVYLSDNRIRHVEPNSFRNTPSLWIIELEYNEIEFINMSFKDTFQNLTELWLGVNPWKCDCELGPLYELFIKLNKINDYGPICDKPPALEGRMWKDISREEFVCPSEDATSTRDSVMSSTEPRTTTEAADKVPVTVYSGTTLHTIVKRRSARRANARKMDSDLALRIIQSSAVSENGNSALNKADVDEE